MSRESERLNHSLNLLRTYIEKEAYRGYDPYDALLSPVFNLPVLKSSKLVRFVAQQVVLRSPINLRRLLAVPKGLNPTTLGLCIQAYSNLYEVFPNQKEEIKDKIYELLDELSALTSKGYSGACWGYDFDWEGRYANIPAFMPTVVVTGFITNALYICHQKTGIAEAQDLYRTSANFVLNDLQRTKGQNGFCFSYSPEDSQQVFNASMKGVKILSQAYALTGNETYKKEARLAVEYVIDHQAENGSWVYSRHKAGINRIDNYHTGYILDALDEYIRLTKDNQFAPNLEKGVDYYLQHFFEGSGVSKTYHNKTLPIDCTSTAQAIISLTRFGKTELATAVSHWTIKYMQSRKGYFYFRKFKNYTVKTSMMRWSNAWMFLALSELLNKLTDTKQA